MLVWREGLHSRLPTAFYPLRISSRQPAIRSTRQADAMRLILRILTSRISNKIILPYLLLALFLATAMTFVAVRLTTGALQDRMDNRLIEAGQVTSDGLTATEDQQIAQLRGMAFTE